MKARSVLIVSNGSSWDRLCGDDSSEVQVQDENANSFTVKRFEGDHDCYHALTWCSQRFGIVPLYAARGVSVYFFADDCYPAPMVQWFRDNRPARLDWFLDDAVAEEPTRTTVVSRFGSPCSICGKIVPTGGKHVVGPTGNVCLACHYAGR